MATPLVKTKASEVAPVEREKRGPEYLANERTFLAWIRTCVALVSLGFVVSRFNLWLRELALGMHAPPPRSSTGTSFWIGELMMAFGGLLAVLAAWRYHVVNRDIERGHAAADRGLILLVTAGVALLSAALTIYMFVTSH